MGANTAVAGLGHHATTLVNYGRHDHRITQQVTYERANFRRDTGQWIRFDRIDGRVMISYSKLPSFTLTSEEEDELRTWLSLKRG